MAFLEYRPVSTLFHYCGAGGFGGITASGSIWLTDLQYANDPKELQLAEVIDGVMSEITDSGTTALAVKATYRHLKRRLHLLRPRFGMYSFSLSLRGDQLPMWQEYTERGRGFCIGFRASAFNDMPLRIQRVNYVRPDYFGSLHLKVEEISRPLVGNENDFMKEIGPVTSILAMITSTKDDTWAHEDEVRLIFSSMAKPIDFIGVPSFPVSILRDGTKVYPADPLVRERNGSQVPYFMKPFGRMRTSLWDCSRAISHVIIGPNNESTPEKIEDNLLKLGYRGFEVTKSRCAFRP